MKEHKRLKAQIQEIRRRFKKLGVGLRDKKPAQEGGGVSIIDESVLYVDGSWIPAPSGAAAGTSSPSLRSDQLYETPSWNTSFSFTQRSFSTADLSLQSAAEFTMTEQEPQPFNTTRRTTSSDSSATKCSCEFCQRLMHELATGGSGSTSVASSAGALHRRHVKTQPFEVSTPLINKTGQSSYFAISPVSSRNPPESHRHSNSGIDTAFPDAGYMSEMLYKMMAEVSLNSSMNASQTPQSLEATCASEPRPAELSSAEIYSPADSSVSDNLHLSSPGSSVSQLAALLHHNTPNQGSLAASSSSVLDITMLAADNPDILHNTPPLPVLSTSTSCKSSLLLTSAESSFTTASSSLVISPPPGFRNTDSTATSTTSGPVDTDSGSELMTPRRRLLLPTARRRHSAPLSILLLHRTPRSSERKKPPGIQRTPYSPALKKLNPQQY